MAVQEKDLVQGRIIHSFIFLSISLSIKETSQHNPLLFSFTSKAYHFSPLSKITENSP